MTCCARAQISRSRWCALLRQWRGVYAVSTGSPRSATSGNPCLRASRPSCKEVAGSCEATTTSGRNRCSTKRRRRAAKGRHSPRSSGNSSVATARCKNPSRRYFGCPVADADTLVASACVAAAWERRRQDTRVFSRPRNGPAKVRWMRIISGSSGQLSIDGPMSGVSTCTSWPSAANSRVRYAQRSDCGDGLGGNS